MLIKFCGIKRQEDVDTARALGANFCGFIFHPASPRAIRPEDAAKIETGNMARVGVFVKQEADEIKAITRAARLDYVQLHGNQSESCARALLPNIIRVLWPARYANPGAMAADAEKRVCKYFLLDSGTGGGGHGEAMDFGCLANLELSRPWFLAGGLNASNIPLALAACKPAGLDINSGVEDAPGIKNAAKMRACMQAVSNEQK